MIDIGNFLDVEIVSSTIPKRESIANVDGRWVREKSDWHDTLTGEYMELFNKTNRQMMVAMGYRAD